MPIKKASWKHLRQTPKRTLRNHKILSTTAKALKQARRALTDKANDTENKIKLAIKALDRAAQKGVIKKNAAARSKSRLMKALHKIVK
ncbi:MAG: 30S ribosomal protein S20 [Patescibacteria group bacterium]